MSRRLVPLILLSVIVVLALMWLARCVFADCPPDGDGGDRLLNALKNRTDSPRSSTSMSVGDLVGLRSPATSASRMRWTRAQAKLVAQIEGAAVTTTGYLLAAREEGGESANCHGSGHDFHLYVGDEARSDRSASVVVEMTPRIRPRGWTIGAVKAIARRRGRVRVTGWLLYDQEHASEVGKSRGTSWEIHPVTRLEVFSGGVWRDL